MDDITRVWIFGSAIAIAGLHMSSEWLDGTSIDGDCFALSRQEILGYKTWSLGSTIIPKVNYQYETITYELLDGVAEICLNRPEIKNAFNLKMWSEFSAALDGFSSDNDQKVLIITGAGGAFCSGAELGDMIPGSATPLGWMRGISDIALKLHHLHKPCIAKVRGIAAGAGANLAFGCDLVYASDSARFSEIFVKRGLSVDFGGSWLLPRMIGLHKAKELAFFGEVISAEKAEEMGLLNRVVADTELDNVVSEAAKVLANLPPTALSLNKALLNDSMTRSMAGSLEAESQAQVVNISTEDFKEAISAFLEKRAPKFTGR